MIMTTIALPGPAQAAWRDALGARTGPCRGLAPGCRPGKEKEVLNDVLAQYVYVHGHLHVPTPEIFELLCGKHSKYSATCNSIYIPFVQHNGTSNQLRCNYMHPCKLRQHKSAFHLRPRDWPIPVVGEEDEPSPG